MRFKVRCFKPTQYSDTFVFSAAKADDHETMAFFIEYVAKINQAKTKINSV
jgi:hypothetical protein